MSSGHPSHSVRTSTEPRQQGLHSARFARITYANPRIRLLRLTLPYSISFLPGQWLDLHLPGVPNAGGFTITSTPRDAAGDEPFIELAVQRAPGNPPAAWLWNDEREILNAEANIRVGGSFVWPPRQTIPERPWERIVMVAGGVGINPLISMLGQIWRTTDASLPRVVRLLYSARIPIDETLDQVLFWQRLHDLFNQPLPLVPSQGFEVEKHLDLFITGAGAVDALERDKSKLSGPVKIRTERISREACIDALGPLQQRNRTAAYVCGPADMTDEIVDTMRRVEGVTKDNVMCEKWW